MKKTCFEKIFRNYLKPLSSPVNRFQYLLGRNNFSSIHLIWPLLISFFFLLLITYLFLSYNIFVCWKQMNKSKIQKQRSKKLYELINEKKNAWKWKKSKNDFCLHKYLYGKFKQTNLQTNVTHTYVRVLHFSVYLSVKCRTCRYVNCPKILRKVLKYKGKVLLFDAPLQRCRCVCVYIALFTYCNSRG